MSVRSSNPAKRAAARRERPVVTFDHLRAKRPVEVPYWVPMDDGTASQKVSVCSQNLARAEMTRKPELVEPARKALDEARAELRANSVRMLFRGISRYDFESLVAAHPPTDAQKDEMRRLGREAEYNYETMAPVLIAAACVEPKLTVEQVELLQHGNTTDENGEELDPDDPEYTAPWNQAEFAGLFQAALQACTSRREADLGF